MNQSIVAIKKAQNNEKARQDKYEELRKDFYSPGAVEILDYLIDEAKADIAFLYNAEEKIMTGENFDFVEENDIIIKDIDKLYYQEKQGDAKQELELVNEIIKIESTDIEFYQSMLEKEKDDYLMDVLKEMLKIKNNHQKILYEKKKKLEEFLEK